MVSSYTSRTFSRRVSSREEEEEGEFVRWGKKEFKRNKKNCISFLATRANNNNSKTTQNFKKQTTYQRFQNAALPARLTPNDGDLRQIDVREFLQTSGCEYVLQFINQRHERCAQRFLLLLMITLTIELCSRASH